MQSRCGPARKARAKTRPEASRPPRRAGITEARAAAKAAFTSLLLGLGAVALLLGGVGIANVMVTSALERRSEIELRRALGATRRHIWAQFLMESLLLSAMGRAASAATGAVVTAVYATAQGQPAVVPPLAIAGGIAAALGIGAVAGPDPSVRASRLSPTEASSTKPSVIPHRHLQRAQAMTDLGVNAIEQCGH